MVADGHRGDRPPAAGHGAPRTASNVLLAARGISKVYRNGGVQIEILKNLDLDLRAGETVAVVGASGIGKSTLLHILGALDRPDRGKLLYRGENVYALNDVKLADFRNRCIGFVFQFHHLLPEFSALENAMMPGLIRGLGKSEAMAAAQRLLVRVGLKDRLNYRVGRLSGGEQQRVALARALVMKPAVLLADEPTGNLDTANSAQVHQLLLALNRELDMTLVVVTHNMELAAYMKRRVTIQHGALADVD